MEIERKQTRFSLSVGEAKHVHVGNYDDISLSAITLLYEYADWQDHEHRARQLGINGGKIELRGDQCRKAIEDFNFAPISKADLAVFGSVVNSTDAVFCLYVFPANEERSILQDALDDRHDKLAEQRKEIERLRKVLNDTLNAEQLSCRLVERLAEKINQI